MVSLVAIALALLPLAALAHIVGWGAAIALALIDPVFGLYWAVLSVPIQDLAQLPGGLSYTQAAMLLAAGAWGLRLLAHPKQRLFWGGAGESRATTFQLWSWCFFLWALLLAVVFTPYSRAEGFKETSRWVEAFLIWLLAVNTLRRPWHLIGLVACLLLAPAADAAVGLVQFATGAGPVSFRIGADSPFVRAYGTIGAPNSFAGYLNMAWPLALALAVGVAVDLYSRPKTKDQRPKGTNFVACCVLFVFCSLLLAALSASFSRGGWVGAAVGALALALAVGRRLARWAIAALGAMIVLLALGGAGLLPGALGARLASITRSISIFDAGSVHVTDANFAVVERMAQMQAGWRMFVAHPLLGVGPGNYTPAYADFAVFPWYISRGHAHNYYLHIAAEAGVVGALAYLVLIAGVVYQARAALRRVNGLFERSAAIGCCGIIGATLGHNLFENLHVLSMGIQLAAVWGLIVVLGHWNHRARTEDRASSIDQHQRQTL